MSDKKMILLVEDNPEILESLAEILQTQDYWVETAMNGQEAFTKLDSLNRIPDLVVSDIKMPIMDGYEFLENVRLNEKYYRIPFIFLTALGEEDQIRYGWDKGVDAYIVKPFNLDSLLSTIRNRIQRHAEIQDMAERQIARTRNVLLKVLSHELRTPLTYVMSGLDLLRESLEWMGVDVSGVADIMDVMNSGTNRLFRVASQTSLLGEIMTGHLAAHWDDIGQVITLRAVTQQALEEIQEYADERQIVFEKDYQSDPPIFAIQNILYRGVYEILRNAAQYSKVGSTVTIRIYEKDNLGIIEIEDHGMGIQPEDIDHVWKVMEQSERDTNEQQGIGLGMTIAKGVFEIHGGDADIESQYGSGTTVWLSLPIYDENKNGA